MKAGDQQRKRNQSSEIEDFSLNTGRFFPQQWWLKPLNFPYWRLWYRLTAIHPEELLTCPKLKDKHVFQLLSPVDKEGCSLPAGSMLMLTTDGGRFCSLVWKNVAKYPPFYLFIVMTVLLTSNFPYLPLKSSLVVRFYCYFFLFSIS